MAYADDVAIYLRGVDQLSTVRHWVETYEMASGAATNWKKTQGILLLGTLRRPGAVGPVCLKPPPAAGDLRKVEWLNEDGDTTMRYLDIYLGGERAVAAMWRQTIVARVERRNSLVCGPEEFLAPCTGGRQYERT